MKSKVLLFAGVIGMSFIACNDETALVQKTVERDQNSLKVVVEETAAAATRADYSGFPSTTFETGDAIGIYAFDGSTYVANNVRFVKQSDGSWDPDGDVPYNVGYTYYAYFPYRSTVYTPSTAGTVNDVDTKFASFISDASDYFWTDDQSTKAGFTYSNLMIAKGNITDAETHTVKFIMAHKRGLAVFTNDAIDVAFTGNIPYEMGDMVMFLMKPTATTTFTDDLGTYSLNAPSGECVIHSVNIPGKDLSKADNAGNTMASRTTANCYLVHEAGEYRIPLIYGNAIKNGTVNTVAFYPDIITFDSNEPRLTTGRFVNHNGDGIIGPWITKSKNGVNAGMGLSAGSAELIWQDVEGLITNVSVYTSYLKFTVGTFNPGNALIAVKDGSGTILWSWHIWATEDDLSNTTVVATGSHDYTVSPVDLGWVPTGGDGKQGYAPYYQWGRKDPFIPAAAYNSTSDHTVYNINGDAITGYTYEVSTDATIADNIKNPTVFYRNSTNNGPVNTTYYNMWDAQNTATWNVATATVKTIYDPCPPGFCVPTGNLYFYIGNGSKRAVTTYDGTNKGATWNTDITGDPLWFLLLTFRRNSTGTIGAIGVNGYRWSATPSSVKNGATLYFYNSYWHSTAADRNYGFTVRPVVE